MTVEKITIRNFWIAIISAIAFVIVTNVTNVFGRISGTAKKVEQIEASMKLKMDKTDADRYFNDLQKLLAKQSTTWDQYMISNEKDKERILKTIETNQEDIKQLIRDQQKLRSANSQ